MQIEPSDRIKQLPPYLFIEIDRKKREAIAAGRDVINLGVGDPDMPTPGFIIDRMADAIREPANHRYPFDEGVPEFRQAAAEWFAKRFEGQTTFDPDTEVLTTIGSKDGIAHLPLAVVNPGQVVLAPEPGYPVYRSSAMFAGADVHLMPLLAENDFLPDFDAIPKEVAQKARLLFLNYPNNPTSAVADGEFFEKAIRFAKAHDILIAQDAAYSEVYFDTRPMSIFDVDGAKDCAVEFYSLSKTFNMTGWRLGFAVGNAAIIQALAKIKGNVDSGQFNAIQWAGIEALRHSDHVEVKALLDIYRERRDMMTKALHEASIEVKPPAATFYMWCRCPGKMDSMTFAGMLLDKIDTVVIPGVGFGPSGEGYFRISLTVGTDRLQEAVDRFSKLSL